MAKLDPVKIKWIITEMNKGTLTQGQIARIAGITDRYVRILYTKYKQTGTIPVLQRPGRPKSTDYSASKCIISATYAMYRCSAATLERIIDKVWNVHIPHNAIHDIMKQNGMASEEVKKKRRRSWIRYERTYSNSLWHTDYKQLDDGRWVITYLDDASRFVTAYGVFEEATTKHALEILYKAMEKYGRPATIMTDHGSQFYTNEQECRIRGESEFEKELVKLEINQTLSGIGHPQTNGKLERFHGEIQRKLRLFRNIDDFYDWYNNIRPHMSLDFENLETPVQAFARKMPQEGIVTDKQSGERYTVQTRNEGVWVSISNSEDK